MTILRELSAQLQRTLFLFGCLMSGVVQAATGGWSIGPPPAWVVPVLPDPAARPPADGATDGTQYLLVDVQTRIDGPQRSTYRAFATKALNERGLEGVANVEVRFDPSFQQLVLHRIVVRRGAEVINKLKPSQVKILQRETELDALVFDGSKTAHAILEDVRVGDTVEYAYTLHGSNPVFGGRHFGRLDMQWATPLTRLHVRLLWPKARPLQLKALNGAPQPVVTETASYRDHAWDLRDLVPMRLERDAPAWYDPYAAVQWGEYDSWRAVVEWALPLYRLPKEPAAGVRDAAERIRANYTEPAERLLAAVRYVQSEVRYLGVEIGSGSHAPSPPEMVLHRRFGDCKDKTLLTVALLRALGFEAAPALVSTAAREGVRDVLPSPGAFNHVLVRARLDGADLWLDPTRRPQGGGLAEWVQSDHGAALVIDAASNGLVGMAAPQTRRDLREVESVFDATGASSEPVDYTVRTVAHGAAAEGLRAALASQTRESLQNQYTNYFANWFTGLTMRAPLNVEDDLKANVIRMTEHYRIAGFWQRNDAKKRQQADISVPDVSTLLRAPQTTVRLSPLALSHPVELRQTTRVMLPSRWNITPGKLRFEHPAFDLTREESWSGSTYTLEDRFVSRLPHLAAADVAGYVAQLDKARQAIAFQLYMSEEVEPASQTPHWLSAVLASLTVLGCALAARRAWRWDPPAPHPPALPGAYEGLGGWLALLGLNLVVGLFRLWRQAVRDLPSYTVETWQRLTVPGSEQYHVLWAPALLANLALSIALFCATALALALYLHRRTSLPWAIRVVLCLSLVLNLISVVSLNLAGSTTDEAITKEWLVLALQVGISGLWLLYLARSERVRATFVRRLPAPASPPQPASAASS